jgi:hypothetical protein
VKNNSFDRAAGHRGTKHMPEFMNRHHAQPTEGQEGGDQNDLVKASHSGPV